MNKQLIFLLFLPLLACLAHAETHTVEQKDKGFLPSTLEVKVGDTVKFLNSDAVSHNVFSLSDAQMFDLGSYPEGESKSVAFDTPGEVEVECAIHPDMQMLIKVLP